MRRPDAVRVENPIDRCVGNVNIFVFRQQVFVMSDIESVIFLSIQRYNQIAYFFGERISRRAVSVPMNKRRFSFTLVGSDITVDRPHGHAQFHRCTQFIAAMVRQFFDNLIFQFLVHS